MKKLILAMAFVFLLTGCQSGQNVKTDDKKNGNVVTEQNNTDNKDQGNTTNNQDENDTTSNQESTEVENITVAPADAIAKFNEKYPDVKIDEFSFGKENRTFVYEISGFDDKSEYEFEVDATDGTILKDNTEMDNTAVNLDLINEIQPLIDNSINEAGSDYHLDSYSVEFEKNGNFNKLDIELENSKGLDIEFEYNIDTKELIKKDM